MIIVHTLIPPSGLGRARSRNPDHLPEPPLWVPDTWPQCLCDNRLNRYETPPSPPTSNTSSSGPPSLESITPVGFPESGYETDSELFLHVLSQFCLDH